MHYLSTSLYIYAAVLFLGGIMGYAKAKSTPSLIAGIVSALIAAGDAVLLLHHRHIGIAIAILLAVTLIVIFMRRYQATKNPMPAMPIIGFSGIEIALAIVSLLKHSHH